MGLEPHIAKWWDIANERRARLIRKKHLGGGLTKIQEAEYLMLQAIAELIMNYASPMDFSELEKLERKVRRLSEAVSRASLKARKEKAR